jgi:hypothetical protein
MRARHPRLSIECLHIRALVSHTPLFGRRCHATREACVLRGTWLDGEQASFARQRRTNRLATNLANGLTVAAKPFRSLKGWTLRAGLPPKVISLWSR